MIGLGVSALAWPSLLPAVPAPNSPAALALARRRARGLRRCSILRASRTFLLTQRALDLVVVVGLVWLGTALVPALTMNYDQLGWWIGHEVELDGILLVGLAVAVDLARAAQSRPLAGDLRGADLVAAEDVFLGSHVRALTVRLADKDEYTERHTRRVALRAVQVGETLGLSASRLRTLAIGALVHDIGKLSVPDAILKKPGPLDEAEYAEVQEHPERGYKLLSELGGFSASVRHLVRDHHERLDGAGYPRGLTADEIDLDTRILTVCDVYDALISKRVYRAAWSHEEAMALLHRETGTAFDARCVAALEQVVAAEQPVAAAAPPAVRQPAVAAASRSRSYAQSVCRRTSTKPAAAGRRDRPGGCRGRASPSRSAATGSTNRRAAGRTTTSSDARATSGRSSSPRRRGSRGRASGSPVRWRPSRLARAAGERPRESLLANARSPSAWRTDCDLDRATSVARTASTLGCTSAGPRPTHARDVIVERRFRVLQALAGSARRALRPECAIRLTEASPLQASS